MKKLLLLMAILASTAGFAQENTQEEKETPRAPYDFLDLFDESRRDKENVLTTTRLAFGIGFTQALGDGNGIGEDYRFWGSGIFEVDLQFHTRLNKDNDNMRFVYGLGLRTTILRVNDNQAFFTQDKVTTLEPIGFDVDRSTFSQSSLIVPLHLEFGARDIKTYRDDLKRYNQDGAFIFGVGGYVGLVTTSSQAIKFDREGRDVTVNTTNDYEVNNFTYGLSAYAGYDDAQIFIQYGLNDILDGSPLKQKYVSIGIRIR